MKSLTFCTFFCISSSLGLSVSFGAAYLFQDTWDEMPELLCRQHEFTYDRGAYFRVFIKLVDEHSAVNLTKVEVFVKKQAGTILFRQHISPPSLQSLVDLNLDYDKITIDVQLSTKKSCKMVRVLKGTEVSTLAGNKNVIKAEYINNICLKGQRCMLFMNLTGLCKNVKLKIQPCDVERDLPLYEDEDSKFRDTRTAPRNCSDSSTSSSTNNSKEEADNTYFTIMIVALVAAAVMMILLLLIIIRQRCWVNSNPRVVFFPQCSPINENPYYENVVFRPKSQPEVEQKEPQIYDEPYVENSYLEIIRRAQLN